MLLCQSCKGPSRHKWCLINRRGLCALYFLHCTTEQDCNTDNKTIWNILLRRPQNVALPKLQGFQPPQVVLDQSSRPLYFVLSTVYHRTRLQYWQQNNLKHTFAQAAECRFAKAARVPVDTSGAWSIVEAFVLCTFYIVPQNKTAILTTKQFETYFCAGRRMSLCQSCKGPSRHKWCLINRRGLCALYFLHCTTEQDCNTDSKTIWNILLRRPQNVALPKLQGSQSTQVVLDQSSRPLCFVLSTLYHRTRLQYWQQNNLKHTFAQAAECRFAKAARVPVDTSGAWSIVEAFVLCTFYIVPQNKTAILTAKQFETYFCAGRRMSLCQSCKGPSRHKWCFTHRQGLCTLYFLLVAHTRLQYWEQGGRVYAVNAVLEFPKCHVNIYIYIFFLK